VLRGNLPKPMREASNAALLKVERAFARPSGLTSRPWYRSLIYAADIDNGYSTMTFPGVNENVRLGNQAASISEITDLAKRFGAAADAVDAARKALVTPISPAAPVKK
jgi:N-acetylated-alpha-linked acidic dipeptidase